MTGLSHCAYRGSAVPALVLALSAAACSGSPSASTLSGGAGRAGSGGGGASSGGAGRGSGGASGTTAGSGDAGNGGAPIIDAAAETPPARTDAADGLASVDGTDAATPASDSGAMPSAGCGKPASDPTGQWAFNKTINVAGATRTYHLRLPTGYDPNKPMRTIFSFHGCGSHLDQLINIQDATGFDAIIIAPEQISGNCFDDQSAMSKDMTVFDALVVWAEDNLCVDQARIFAIGFSSGSWMTNILGCERPNILRAKANVSGGLTGAIVPSRDCKGPVAGIFLHDASDTQNPIADGMYARSVLLMEDGCSMTSQPYTMVPANSAGLCVTYDGCKPGFPVVWCQTTGINHDPQQSRSPNLFWEFLSQF
jgi:poly(3-hydroxybutyrate) depolymerase